VPGFAYFSSHMNLKSQFSCGAFIVAGDLCCTTGSVLYELDARKPVARYNVVRLFWVK
jgi:hypothetical protein